MGRTLYDTIYLGRGPFTHMRRGRVALALGVAACAGLGWLTLRSLR